MEGQSRNNNAQAEQYQFTRMGPQELAKQQELDVQIKDVMDVVMNTVMCRVDRAFIEYNEQLCANMPQKVESIERYLHMLYEAQRSGHDVHKEIDDALKQFKEAAGI